MTVLKMQVKPYARGSASPVRTRVRVFSHTYADVAAELAGTAFAALVAIESLNGDAAAELLRCAERARRRH